MSQRINLLSITLLKFQQELTKEIAVLEGVKAYQVALQFSQENWLRLLNLKVWSTRYKIPVRLILEILLHGYYRKVRKKNKSTASLGLAPAVLTGPTSQHIVEEYIKKCFPNQEHLESYRAKQKSRILGMVITGKPLAGDSMVEEYRKHIEHKRYLLDSGTKEFRRPWRENPWRKSSLTTPTSKIT